jgi:hypothetical protein
MLVLVRRRGSGKDEPGSGEEELGSGGAHAAAVDPARMRPDLVRRSLDPTVLVRRQRIR